MKTGGEKHDNWKHDVDWNCMTPTSTKQVKNAKKERVKEYKRRARRFAKQITRLFIKDED